MSTYVKITGVEAVRQAFSRFPEDMRITMERSAIRRAANLIADSARSLAPRDTGLFAESHGVVVRTYRNTNTVLAVVGSRRSPQFKGRANIAHLIESGFRVGRGGTLKRKSGSLAPESRATGTRGEGVAVRFVRGKQVMQRAFQMRQAQVRAMIEQGIERSVNRILKKQHDAG